MWRRRSPSVMMPTSLPSRVGDADAAEALGGHLHDRVRHRACRARRSGTASPVCMTSRTNFSMRAEPAARMQDAEVERREAAAFQQRDRERVAERKLHQRGGGRREIVRAGFARLRQQQHDVGGLARACCRRPR